MATMTNLIDILSLVSSSAMKGSIFLGELPTSLAVESSQIEAKVYIFFHNTLVHIWLDV